MNRLSRLNGFLAMLLVGLLAVVYTAGQRGLAYVLAQEPRYEIERWRSGKFAAGNAKFDAIQADLHQALGMDPGNPDLVEDLARLHAARVERGQSYDTPVREMRQQALAGFRQAVQLRPTSGHGWVNVALTKFRLGEVDQEFSGALQQALRRSPWEPKVQMIAIELGLASWQALSDSTRAAIQQAIRSQTRWKLANQKPALQSLLKRYQRPDLAYLL